MQLRQLADERERDAQALLLAGRWSGAYYLAGYAVECGLKACIAKLTQPGEFPEKEHVLKSYTHKIEQLVDAADLQAQRVMDMTANPVLGRHWIMVKDWNELARYRLWTEFQASKLVVAVSDASNGVLPWIRVHW
jgi:HEPN domain-containing protein